jgi:hypothetical protein
MKEEIFESISLKFKDKEMERGFEAYERVRIRRNSNSVILLHWKSGLIIIADGIIQFALDSSNYHLLLLTLIYFLLINSVYFIQRKYRSLTNYIGFIFVLLFYIVLVETFLPTDARDDILIE